MSNPGCQYLSFDAQNPTAIDNLGNSDDTSEWAPLNVGNNVDNCWEPYSQYIIYDVSNLNFSSIGIGTNLPIASDIYGIINPSPSPTTYSLPKYISFALASTSVIDYNNDLLFDQYWVQDMTQLTPNNKIYDSSPIFWMFDTKPSNNSIRMNEIDSGFPEQYVVSKTFNIYSSNVDRIFTTWTAIFASSQQTSDSTGMNNMAIVGCSSAMGYTPSPTVGFGSASSTEMNCYGIGGGTALVSSCQSQDIYYPVAGFYLNTAFIGDYCTNNDILTINNYLECDITANDVGEVDECIPNSQTQRNNQFKCDDSSQGLSTRFPIRFTCAPTTNIQTAFPTQTSSPSISPTSESPTLSTTSPTLSTLPPSKSPTLSPSNTPTLTPSQTPTLETMAPTEIPTFSPSLTPTSESSSPTKSPSQTPTNTPTIMTSDPTLTPTLSTSNPSIPPTSFPSVSPSSSPTDSPTEIPPLSPSVAPTVIKEEVGSNPGFAQWWLILVVVVILFGLCALLMFLYFRNRKERAKPTNSHNKHQQSIETTTPNGLPQNQRLMSASGSMDNNHK